MSSPLAPESVTLDELEAATTAPPAPNLGEIKVDGEGIPDELKGKSVQELLAHAANLSEALKTSERSRLNAEQMATLATRTQPVEQPKVQQEPELTEEQLKTLYDENPIKAIEYMNARAERRVQQNIEARMGNLFTSTAATAEQAARQKFATEFEVLGPEISNLISQIPNAKQVLTTPDAWERLVALARGAPGSFEKMVEHHAAKRGAPTRQSAQAAEGDGAGISLTSSVRAPSARRSPELDATEKEIAKNLNMTEADYIKWRDV